MPKVAENKIENKSDTGVESKSSKSKDKKQKKSVNNTENKKAEVPVAEVPVAEAPVTEAPVTEAPVTEAPAEKGKPKKEKKIKEKKEKKEKKPRAKTAYNFFVSSTMKKLMTQEEWKSKKNSELMKECGNLWKSTSVEDKEPFTQLSVDDKKRLNEVKTI